MFGHAWLEEAAFFVGQLPFRPVRGGRPGERAFRDLLVDSHRRPFLVRDEIGGHADDFSQLPREMIALRQPEVRASLMVHEADLDLCRSPRSLIISVPGAHRTASRYRSIESTRP